MAAILAFSLDAILSFLAIPGLRCGFNPRYHPPSSALAFAVASILPFPAILRFLDFAMAAILFLAIP
jgi:hypothetical protein